MPAPQVEDFDDDFDFELPSVPTSSGGARTGSPQMTDPAQIAAFQQAMMSGQGPPGMDALMRQASNTSGRREKGDDQDAKHKHWNTVYPIYFDAKRHYKQGARRVPYGKSCACPQSTHIAKAASRLGFEFHHEPFKVHPQDWENPGRVKIRLLSESGEATNPKISNRHQLLLAIAETIQPLAGGTPPPLPKPVKKVKQPTVAAGAIVKGKAEQDQMKSKRPLHPLVARRKALALPPIAERLPPHSPALETGMLNSAGGAGNPGKALGMLGGLGGLLGGMGLGDSDDEDEGEKPKLMETETQRRHREEKEHMEKMMAQAKKQRKRVVRVGR